MDFISKNFRGVLFCFALAVPATYLGKLFPVVGAPVFAILFGLLVAFWNRPAFFQPGIQFTAKKILQYSIILLGFGMNLFEILAVGSQSLAIIIATISTALIVAYVLSKVMNIERDIATLVGVGSSICGGSAIAAAAPVIKASDKDIAQSISVIFLFNVVAAFLFPALGDMLNFTDTGFGMWAKNTVSGDDITEGVAVINRTDFNYFDVANAIMEAILTLSHEDQAEIGRIRQRCLDLARNAEWSKFIAYYLKAFDIAIRHAEERNR